MWWQRRRERRECGQRRRRRGRREAEQRKIAHEHERRRRREAEQRKAHAACATTLERLLSRDPEFCLSRRSLAPSAPHTSVILYCGVPTSSEGYSGHCTFAEPERRGVVGTVLAAAGEGEGGGQRVSARGPAQRAQTAKIADFSFARCARGQFFFARCARVALLRSHLSYLRRGDRSRASEGSPEILILAPS